MTAVALGAAQPSSAHFGASFIEKAAAAHIDVKHNIVYVKPGVKSLKYDVFTPKGAMRLPIIVIGGSCGGGAAPPTH